MSIESRIDIVVKNLNQLNKLADNLKNINKTNEKLVKGLDRIESQLNKLNTSGVAFKKVTKDAREASKEVNNLGSRIADIISNNKGGIGNFGLGGLLGVGAVSGITKITDGFKNLVPAVNAVTSKIPVLGEKLQMVQQQATGFDAVFDGILHNVANHPSLWGAAAVALTVFGGKFPVVVKGVKQLAVTLNGVGQAVTNNIVGKIAPATKHLVDMRVALVDVREQMENMTRGASLEELNIMVGMARKEMESFWHMTGKAEDAATKLAVAMEAQRKEQTAINDLLFKAQGKATTAEQADNKRALEAQKQKATHSYDMFSTEAKQLEIVQRKNKLFVKSAGHYKRLVERGGKMLDIEQRIEQVMNRRKRGIGGVGGMGGKGGENLMLGAGFPLLFGGGVGSVAGGVTGALLGNMMGAGGFGMQILLSAVGQMMDTAVQKAAKLGEALRDLSMDDLIESGIRFTGQLQAQVDLLRQAGRAAEARALVEAQVMDQTGASAGVLGDINSITSLLKATWDDLVGSVGAFLGVISGPLIVALAGVLKIVTEVFKLFNRGFSTLRDGFRGLGETFAPGLVQAIDNAMEKLNKGLQEAIAKAQLFDTELNRRGDRAVTVSSLKGEMALGSSYADKVKNVGLERSIAEIDFNAQTRKEEEELKKSKMFGDYDFTQYNINRRAEFNALMADYDRQLEKISYSAEQKLVDVKEETALTKNKIKLGEREALVQAKIEKLVKSMGEHRREDIITAVRALDKADKQLEKTKQLEEMWKSIKDTIATGLTNAITGLIEGTQTLSQALSGILKQIGQILMQKALTSWIGGMNFGGGGVTTGSVSDLPKVVAAAQGAYFGNGIKPFSTGGMATRPTLGLVGEAGESEYIIPASKMAASMQRYSAGARGEAVIPGAGSSYAGGGAGGSTTINYSGPILNFNSEEFVPKSAVGEIIATATSRGAKAGENRTLSTLRNSRSTRSRLGM